MKSKELEIDGPTFSRSTVGVQGAAETLTVRIAKPGKNALPAWLEKLLTDADHESLREVLNHPRHEGNIAYAEPYGASDTSLAALLAFPL